MPAFDGTGPQGLGSRTGGGFGYCQPVAGGNTQNTGVVYGVGRGGVPYGGGRGFAYGGGRGRGGGRRFWRGAAVPVVPVAAAPAQVTPQDELAYLREQSQAMQAQLDQINERMTQLTQTQE